MKRSFSDRKTPDFRVSKGEAGVFQKWNCLATRSPESFNIRNGVLKQGKTYSFRDLARGLDKIVVLVDLIHPVQYKTMSSALPGPIVDLDARICELNSQGKCVKQKGKPHWKGMISEELEPTGNSKNYLWTVNWDNGETSTASS